MSTNSLRNISILTAVMLGAALILVFFYAPLDADLGRCQRAGGLQLGAGLREHVAHQCAQDQLLHAGDAQPDAGAALAVTGQGDLRQIGERRLLARLELRGEAHRQDVGLRVVAVIDRLVGWDLQLVMHVNSLLLGTPFVPRNARSAARADD